MCLSLSDDANKIKLWILKGHNSFSYLWKFEPNTTNGFWRNSLLKTRNFTENVWPINFFAPHSNYAVLFISFNIACKELKIAQIVQLNQLFQLLHLVHIYSHGFYELSRMLMRKNVDNDVSIDSPIFGLVFFVLMSLRENGIVKNFPFVRKGSESC